MGDPCCAVGKARGRVPREQGDDLAGQVVLAHVDERGIVDQMRRITSIQRLEKVQPAVGARGDEGGELIVADVYAHAVLRLVASPGVVDRDPRGRVEARAQHVARFVEKNILAGDQQPHELTLRDYHAKVL